MLSLLSAVVFFLAGSAVRERYWRDDLRAAERFTVSATIGLLSWLATNWILALIHSFVLPALIVRLIVVAAIVIFAKRRTLRLTSPISAMTAIAFAPLALWIVFILWRGAIIPPASHDALAYHLPKAVFITRDAGFVYHADFNDAIRTLPVNYELMLAEEIVWSGSDDFTEWVSLPFFLLWIAACGGLTERWWNGNPAAVKTVMLLSAGIPVVLLHSGAVKNDLMVAAFLVAGLVAAGRWITDAHAPSLTLTIAAFAAAVGTKPQAAIVAVCLAPMLRRHLDIRLAFRLLLFSTVAFLLLGGAVFVTNLRYEHSLLNARQVDGQELKIAPYGDWPTLWQGPYVLLAAPFSGNPRALTVPGESGPWFWRRYELYFSHVGLVVSLCAMAAPFAFLWTRGLDPATRRERLSITIAACAAFVVMLPVGFLPHGLYTISLPRYALFIVPIVFGWTIGPWIDRLTEGSAHAGPVALCAAALLFTANAISYGAKDAFTPIDSVLWARAHPGTRAVAFDPFRAASVADRLAGPRDRIAIDASFGTWIEPAFGRRLERPVDLIGAGGGPPLIRSDAKWVVVDRAYRIVWGHPDFRDLSQARRYLLRGRPSAADLRVFDALRADSRFRLVFYNPRMLQAVFQRVVDDRIQ